ISIAHVNDVHAHYSPFNRQGNTCTQDDIDAGHCYGGAARMATVFKTLRKRNPGHTYSLMAGDEFQGTDFYTYTKGAISAKVMNYIGYDLMTIGNHEFDEGPEHLAKFFQELRFPKVCANANFRGVPELDDQVRPYHIFKEHSLAVIGYITKATGYISSAGPLVSFGDPAPAVQRVIDRLRSKGIKRIIALSHNGYEEDMEVARRTRGLSLIVGGHTHTYLSMRPDEPESKGLYPTPVKGTDGLTTYVVQAKAFGEYIGILDVTFNDHGRIDSISGAPIHVELDVPEDREMAQMVQGWRKELDVITMKEVGRARAEFDRTSCQTGECQAGNLVTDSFLYSRRAHPDVRAAFIDAGSVRAGIPKGVIRLKDAKEAMPFDNALVDITMTGRQLYQMFEDILAKENRESGRAISTFIQVSGLIVEYNPRSSTKRQLSSINVHSLDKNDFEDVDPAATYTLVTTDYLARGGDGFL
ncbi:Metallo-dependent phosphatase-like protein, partial [Syncephalis pseudoplumigaleata]